MLKSFANTIVLSTITRNEIIDAIAFAQINVKFYYDRKHHSIILVVENWALLRFHKSYNIFFIAILKKKINQQYIEFFRVIEKIDRLIYRINVSSKWRIHSIVFITQLKLYSTFSTNFFRKSRFINSNFVFVENDTTQIKFYELKRLINKRMIVKRNVEYFVKWKKYNNEHDVWKNLSKLDDIMNFVRQYENSIRHMTFLFNRQKFSIFKILRKNASRIIKSSTISNTLSIIKNFFANISSIVTKSSRSIVARILIIVISSQISSIVASIVKISTNNTSIVKNFFANFSSIVISTFVDVSINAFVVLTFISKAMILRRFEKLAKKK